MSRKKRIIRAKGPAPREEDPAVPRFDPEAYFELKAPKWTLRFCLAVAIGCTVLFLILRYAGAQGKIRQDFLELSYLLIPLAMAGAVGVYAYFREKLSYVDGVYTYRPAFGKTRSATAGELGSVTIETTYVLNPLGGERTKIVIYFRDREKNSLFKIMDDDEDISGDPLFIRSLRYHHIPIRRRTEHTY